ncbi:MAG TPA: hypothetical protein VFY21_00920 [Xanthobacteraceae bacterium]|nr:hypothetical protein [Xanthobacteraceae bacterium]
MALFKPRGGLLRLSDCPGARHYRFQIPGEFVPCNPSLAADGDGFLALVRTVNDRIDEGGIYRVTPGSTSINWLLRLDSSLRVQEAAAIDDEAWRGAGPGARHGFQDGRLFRWQDRWWFAAAAKSSFNPARYTFALCRLDGNRVEECRFVPSPIGMPVEKNWMPRVLDGALAFVYWMSPTQIVHCDADGHFDFQVLAEPATEFAGWSGSSQVVPYRRNWLCVVHFRHRDSQPHRYSHAFIEFDRDFRILRSSDPWVFDAPTIEFCSSLCIAGDEAILGYGVWDREARLLRVPLSAVDRLLDRGGRALLQRALNIYGGVTTGSRTFTPIGVTERPSGV